MIKKGIDIVIKSRDKGSFKIVPITEDDTLMTKEAFFAKVDKGIEQIKNGQSYTMLPGENLEDFLNRIEE